MEPWFGVVPAASPLFFSSVKPVEKVVLLGMWLRPAPNARASTEAGGRKTARHRHGVHGIQGAVRTSQLGAGTAWPAEAAGTADSRSARSARHAPCRGRARDSRSERHLHIAHVKDLEILPGDGVFVASAQKADLVGVLQFLDASGITPELLDEMFHRPRVLHSAMNHLFFPIALHLVHEFRSHDNCGDGNKLPMYKQYEGNQNVSALSRTAAGGGSDECQKSLRFEERLVIKVIL